jgi:tetratricopeptide (TPR) repeat protein
MTIFYRIFCNRVAVGSAMVVTSFLSVPDSVAFNPNTGGDNIAVLGASSALPDTSSIYSPLMNRPITTNDGYIPPAQVIEMPKPLYPDRVNHSAVLVQPPVDASVANPVAAAVPPVSSDVQAKAKQILAADAQAPLVAPTPLTATTSPLAAPPKVTPLANMPAATTLSTQEFSIAPVPSIASAPLILTPPPEAVAQALKQAAAITQARTRELSEQTRTILSNVPGNLDKEKPSQPSSVAIRRVSPEIKELLGNKAKEESYEAVGLSIKVRRPGLDTNYELNRAYTALMGGDTEAAIETYKNILSTDSSNQDALFGLAATYHRLGNFDKARPLYGALLKINPQHREGLNNFLALASDESPQDALPELERLEARNPDFSPIPAQIAIVLDKLGFKDEARAKMLRAIDLAPDNMTYKYNLAIMLDHHGRVADAKALYRMLIESSLHGQKVPASADAMQRRLNYLSASASDVAVPSMATTIN